MNLIETLNASLATLTAFGIVLLPIAALGYKILKAIRRTS